MQKSGDFPEFMTNKLSRGHPSRTMKCPKKRLKDHVTSFFSIFRLIFDDESEYNFILEAKKLANNGPRSLPGIFSYFRCSLV